MSVRAKIELGRLDDAEADLGLIRNVAPCVPSCPASDPKRSANGSRSRGGADQCGKTGIPVSNRAPAEYLSEHGHRRWLLIPGREQAARLFREHGRALRAFVGARVTIRSSPTTLPGGVPGGARARRSPGRGRSLAFRDRKEQGAETHARPTGNGAGRARGGSLGSPRRRRRRGEGARPRCRLGLESELEEVIRLRYEGGLDYKESRTDSVSRSRRSGAPEARPRRVEGGSRAEGECVVNRDEAKELIPLYAANDLDETTRAAVAAAIAGDASCLEELREFEALEASLRESLAPRRSPSLR